MEQLSGYKPQPLRQQTHLINVVHDFIKMCREKPANQRRDEVLLSKRRAGALGFSGPLLISPRSADFTGS